MSAREFQKKKPEKRWDQRHDRGGITNPLPNRKKRGPRLPKVGLDILAEINETRERTEKE